MREAPAAREQYTRTRLLLEISSSAALLAFISPGQLSRTAANTYDTASVPPVAGDDPVNESDPSGDFSSAVAFCNGPGPTAYPGVTCELGTHAYPHENCPGGDGGFICYQQEMEQLHPTWIPQYTVVPSQAGGRGRRWDLYDPSGGGTAYELKVGLQYANSLNLAQISFDQQALQDPGAYRHGQQTLKLAAVRWLDAEQYPSYIPNTPISGVSSALAGALSAAFAATGGRFQAIIYTLATTCSEQ